MPDKIIRIPTSSEGKDQDISLFKKIIDSPAFQVKRDIKQLDFVYKLFPGATHTRFEHMIGTLYNAEILLDNIRKNGNGGCKISASEETTIKLAALLHDIGHPALSHATEQILHLYGEPDHNKKAIEYITLNEELIKNVKGVNYDLLIDLFNEKSNYYDIIWSVVGADKLDYVDRDSKACGVQFKSDTERIRMYAQFDGMKYGIEMKGENSVAQHLTNWLTLHFEVYLRKQANIIKGLFRRGLYELLQDDNAGMIFTGDKNANRKLALNSIWGMTDGELLSKLTHTKRTREIYDRLIYRKLPKTFLSVKIEGYGKFEDVRNKSISVYEMPEKDLSKLVKRFDNIQALIDLEKSLETTLGYPELSITVSELPHIERIQPKKVNIYNVTTKEWTTILDRMPELDSFFRNSARRHYSLRICTVSDYRKEAYDNVNKVIEALEEYNKKPTKTMENYISKR